MINSCRLFLLLILTCYCSISRAQQGSGAEFIHDPVTGKKLLDGVTERYNKDLASLNGTYKKYLAEIYKQRYDLIKERLSGDVIITDPKAMGYLSALTREITRANPQLKSEDLRIVFSEDWWPNASSMGEGTILFNIGLFNRLENESQAAFTLCHELAHYYLDHGNKNISQYVNAFYSDDMQKELKSIQKSGYRQNQQLENLAKSLSFRHRRHSRSDEKAADSMAIEFMKNTNFDLTGALECLALLDSVDQDKFSGPLDLQRRFDFPSFRFKNSWIESDALLFIAEKGNKDPEADSLKTHPDCSIRIRNLDGSVKNFNKAGNKKFVVDEAMFMQLKNQFDFEIPRYLFQQKQISKCLYYSLRMLNHFPDNPRLHTLVGSCLNEIHDKQKSHQLGNIVDLPSPLHDEEYNKLLHLIQNIRLYEIASLSYYYLQANQPVAEKDPLFNSVWAKSKENFIK